jgi:O-antigen ligase
MGAGVEAAAVRQVALGREGALARMARRWSGLLHASTVAFVVLLYANPMYWWPWVERLRLAFLAMALATVALAGWRVSSGERLRLGGPGAGLLLAFLAFVPASWLWTIDAAATREAAADALKFGLAFVIVQNGLDSRTRLRRFLLAAALASAGPAVGGIQVWLGGEGLVDGFRTHWTGLYADPNRLAMSLVAVLPFALYGAFTARRRAARVLFAAIATAQVAAIVLTHSRSGAIAAAVAGLLFLFRGRNAALRGSLAAAAIGLSLVALAPATFWERQASLGDLEEDASVAGREAAWKVLGVIVDERPLTGVGAGAFIAAWGPYAPLEAGGHRYVAHNVFLEIVGELGILAFALFALFSAWILIAAWRAGRDPLVGAEARAVLAGLAGYLLCEMANGYTRSWFLFFLFGCAAAVVRLARLRAVGAGEADAWPVR